MMKADKQQPGANQLDLFAPATSTASPQPQKKRRQQFEVRPAPLPSELQPVAQSLPETIRLGTSSWSFPGWEGLIYDRSAPQTQLSREGLTIYSQHPLLRTVGVDRTYYRPMTAAQFATYAEQVPDTLRFLVKAHKYCTLNRFSDHPRYGTRRRQQNGLFLDPQYATQEVVGTFMDGLQDKAGSLLFQFSPQDFAQLGGPEYFVERLHRFLDALPRGPLYAVELRNAEVFTPEYVDALSAAGACHCLNGHPSMPPIRDQAALAQPEPALAVVIRRMQVRHLSYQTAKEKYAPFNQIVDADLTSRNAIAELCLDATARQHPAYVIVNNKAEGSAPLSIFHLAEQIVAKINM
jgi:uncharacterized protein YecE (DUF72 family)